MNATHEQAVAAVKPRQPPCQARVLRSVRHASGAGTASMGRWRRSAQGTVCSSKAASVRAPAPHCGQHARTRDAARRRARRCTQQAGQRHWCACEGRGAIGKAYRSTMSLVNRCHGALPGKSQLIGVVGDDTSSYERAMATASGAVSTTHPARTTTCATRRPGRSCWRIAGHVSAPWSCR